jgi:hypothetical protein
VVRALVDENAANRGGIELGREPFESPRERPGDGAIGEVMVSGADLPSAAGLGRERAPQAAGMRRGRVQRGLEPRGRIAARGRSVKGSVWAIVFWLRIQPFEPRSRRGRRRG